MDKPLSTVGREDDTIDRALLQSAIGGDRNACEELVRRHQRFVFDLSVRMLGSHADAEDATQEILLKIVTGLGSYRGEAAFRTWAYRIAFNHLLAFRSRRSSHGREHSFEQHGDILERSPDLAIPDECLGADIQLVIEEVKATCLSGLLLCLDREHRLAFVLGEIFEATDVVCAELLGISRENVRQRISRAREQLRAFLNGRCGLIDLDNPCRCARKTRSFIQKGFVDPTKLRFTAARLQAVNAQVSEGGARRLEELADETFARLLREQALGDAPDCIATLRECLDRSEFRKTLELDN